MPDLCEMVIGGGGGCHNFWHSCHLRLSYRSFLFLKRLGTAEWRCRVFSSRSIPFAQIVGQLRKLSYRMPTANGRNQPEAAALKVSSATAAVLHSTEIDVRKRSFNY